MEESMSKQHIAVVGCGIFGALCALRLHEAGFVVTVFERNSSPLQGASYNNQNRLHLGFHYPRDLATAEQCIRGFERFMAEFSPCINSSFANGYFIAKQGSFTTPDDYRSFCNKLGVFYKEIDSSTFFTPVVNVGMGLVCNEVVYDSEILGQLVIERLSKAGISVIVDASVETIAETENGYILTLPGNTKKSFDGVVNATYANINRFSHQLGLEVTENQYEYTAVAVIKPDFTVPLGVTIMDGSFMTVLPFGKTGNYLLYHVDHSVIERKTQVFLPQEWLTPDTSPFVTHSKQDFFENMVKTCSYFVPALTHSKYIGHLEGPRMVLARKDATDARPSIINELKPGYITIFSGKIDHCIWVADDVVSLFNKRFIKA
jgi:hypothetical protein